MWECQQTLVHYSCVAFPFPTWNDQISPHFKQPKKNKFQDHIPPPSKEKKTPNGCMSKLFIGCIKILYFKTFCHNFFLG